MWLVIGYFAIAGATGAWLLAVVLVADSSDGKESERCVGSIILGLLWPLVWFVVPVVVAGAWLASRKKPK